MRVVLRQGGANAMLTRRGNTPPETATSNRHKIKTNRGCADRPLL